MFVAACAGILPDGVHGAEPQGPDLPNLELCELSQMLVVPPSAQIAVACRPMVLVPLHQVRDAESARGRILSDAKQQGPDRTAKPHGLIAGERNRRSK